MDHDFFYNIPTDDFVKVPGTKDTEPAIFDLFSARRKRKDREKRFNRSSIGKENAEGYLKSIAKELKHRTTAMHKQIYEIGKLLVDAKSILPHGGFEPWLKENWPLSRTSALNYMRVYKACMGTPQLVEYFDSSKLYIICAPGFSKDLREALFNNAEGIFETSDQELLETSMKFKKGEVDIDSPEVQSILKQQKDTDYYERYDRYLVRIKNILEQQYREAERLLEVTPAYPLLPKEDQHRPEIYSDIKNMVESFITETENMLCDLYR